MFKALLLEKDEPGFRAQVTQLDDSRLGELQDGEVLLQPAYSTLNYKDGLALCNRAPVVRLWPMVPGIDGAGQVLASRHPAWQAGDQVVHNGWGVGETAWGCLAERVRLKGDGLLRLPSRLSARQAMSLGTAGYTAMLCVLALQARGVAPGSGEVLVTGASGGVGSVATLLLARRGYEVVAASGKLHESAYLQRLGAARVMDRAELISPGKPLQKERWAAVVDAVGSHTLVNALAQTRYGGVVAACGLAQGADLPATVLPFILRGVSLVGVDSVMAPLAQRQAAWSALAQEVDLELLESLTEEVSLDEALAAAARLMAGKVRGRIVVKI